MRIPQPKAESTTSHTSTLQGSDSTSIHQPLDLPWFRTFAQRKTSATSPLDSTSMSPLSDYEGVLLSPVSSAGSQVTVRTPSPEESQRPIERSSTFYRPLTVRAESLGSNFQDATHGRMLYEQPEPMRSPVSAALSPVLIRPPSYTFIDNVPTSTTLDYSTIIEQRAGSPVSRLSTPQSLYESRPSTAIQDSQYAAERTRRLSEAIRLDSPTPISIRSPSPVSPSAHTRTCRGCISIARSPSPPGFTPHTGSPTSNRSSSPAYSIYPRICTPMPPMSPHYSSRLFRPPSISPDTVDRSRNLASATYHSPVLAHPRVHSPATQVTISRSSTPVFAPNRLMSPQPASEITSTVIIDSPREPPSVIPPTYTYPDIPAVLHSMYDDDSSNNAGASRRTYKTPNAGHSESSQLSPPTVLPILLQSFSDDNGNGPSIGPSAGNGHINNRQPRFIPSVAPSAQNVPANRPHWSRQRYDGGGGSGQPNIHAASSHPNSATFRSDHAKSTPRVPWTGPVLQPRISPRTRYPPSSLSTIPVGLVTPMAMDSRIVGYSVSVDSVVLLMTLVVSMASVMVSVLLVVIMSVVLVVFAQTSS
ncbi:hypothetical protein J3R30DRAFT_1095372 [Lentinula aciculospora]|uniref:Uncharacterized protein n=1 Tax=Lentinula aciculospora TaxID=153920 RepID=A0A9W9A0L1_9AGAR|nr:hypothetical protein J3R30DRAFT_1095372 [Lentinula aciculospora]